MSLNAPSFVAPYIQYNAILFLHHKGDTKNDIGQPFLQKEPLTDAAILQGHVLVSKIWLSS